FEADPDFARAVKTRFTSAGADVDVVADAAEGLELAAKQPPSLILLTVELGKTNGFLVCKKIKKTPELSSIPLVLLSSSPDAEGAFEQHKQLKYRADEYVKKPVGMDALFQIAKRFVALEELHTDDRTEILSRDEVDAEIDKFADDAFDSLFVSDEPAAPSAPVEEESIEDILLDDALEMDEMDDPFQEPPVETAPKRPTSLPPPPPVASVPVPAASTEELEAA